MNTQVRPHQDIRQTAEYRSFLSHVGWYIVPLKQTNSIEYALRWVVPYTPYSYLYVQRASTLALDVIEHLAQKYKIIAVHMEPNILANDIPSQQTLERYGYTQSSWIQTSTKTVVLDLRKSTTELYASFQKRPKRGLRKAKKLQVVSHLYDGNEVIQNPILCHTVLKLIEQHERRLHIHGYTNKWMRQLIHSFGSKALIIVVSYDEKPIACGVFLCTSEAMYYCRGATTSIGRDVNATALCMWEAIQNAKIRGLRFFDFEGIYDDRYAAILDNWKGFSVFKESFGGTPVLYLPAYEKTFIHTIPSIYKLIQKIVLPKYVPGLYALLLKYS